MMTFLSSRINLRLGAIPLFLLGVVTISSCYTNPVEGWSFYPSPITKKVQCLTRKAFLVGTASGFVLGTATVAGAAVIVNDQIYSKGTPYEPLPGSMDGEVVVITGGTTGLGLESAKRLATAGATIVLTSRNEAKGEKAVENVVSYLKEKGLPTITNADDDNNNKKNNKIYSLVLDLDDLASVKAFPDSYKKLGLGDINILMNNAGVMAIPDRQLTLDGFERTFQSNHLGHFVLTAGLFPFLSRKKATVINVSSEAYQFAGRNGLDINNLNGENSYGPWTSYGQSKLANILFTKELQKRADASGNDHWFTAVTLHPGAVSTDLGRYLIGDEKWNELKTKGPSPLETFALNAFSLFTKTIPEGASTQIYLAVTGANGTLQKGEFYEDMMVKSLPPFARDEVKAKELWTKSEQLSGVSFSLDTGSVSTNTRTADSTESLKLMDDRDAATRDVQAESGEF
jgi:NAD(P)-dependent dehydrogenase (short-subunit alcohol dehydrogenase family)